MLGLMLDHYLSQKLLSAIHSQQTISLLRKQKSHNKLDFLGFNYTVLRQLFRQWSALYNDDFCRLGIYFGNCFQYLLQQSLQRPRELKFNYNFITESSKNLKLIIGNI